MLYLSNFITLLPSPIHEIMSIQYSFNLFWWMQRESLDILSQRILDKTLIISNVGVGKVFDIDGYFVCAVIQMYVGRYVIRISLKIKQNIILARGPWPTSLIWYTVPIKKVWLKLVIRSGKIITIITMLRNEMVISVIHRVILTSHWLTINFTLLWCIINSTRICNFCKESKMSLFNSFIARMNTQFYFLSRWDLYNTHIIHISCIY